jgi:selenide,water dikinase
VGNASADDAAVYRLGPDQVMVQTVDFFTPVVDDPYLFGQIAAANALSDVYAMRGRPILALALVAFPTTVLPVDVLEQILRGGADKVAEAGAVIGGGHSIDHDVPLYGLAVTGTAKESELTRNSGARPGDALVLTKPLGIGVTVCAGRADSLAAEGVTGLFRKSLLSDAAREEAGRTMAALNRSAVEAMEGFEVHSATDVTGYGLLGHAHEMMEASATTAQFWVDAIPLLSEARRLAAKGIAPDGSRVNVRNLRPRSDVGPGVTEDDFLLLSDAQTSGGLLVALPAEQGEDYARRCRERGAVSATVVGRVAVRGKYPLEVRKNETSGRKA